MSVYTAHIAVFHGSWLFLSPTNVILFHNCIPTVLQAIHKYFIAKEVLNIVNFQL